MGIRPHGRIFTRQHTTMNPKRLSRLLIAVVFGCCLATCFGPDQSTRADEPKQTITHSFLACGQETFIADGQGKVTWQYPRASRDGWVLTGGDVLLAVAK